MSRGSSLTVLAVLAASGALIAGCSSSSSSSSSAPTASVSAPATSASSSAPASAPTSSTAAGSSTKPSAADCEIINKISSGVVAVLEPLQTEPTAKAAAALKSYVALLTTEAAKLTSPAGKAALDSFITAFKKAQTETEAKATAAVTTAIGNLGSACS